MKTPFTKSKKGFTIIEVSLVLAIGGLIMLMVFIAWPAVQRNQHDSQRRTVDLPKLHNSLSLYMTNNNGKLPPFNSANPGGAISYIEGKDTAAEVEGTDDWSKFYKNYMLAQGDTFVDPLGTNYSIVVSTCSDTKTAGKPNNNLSATDRCTNTISTEADYGSVTLFSDGEIVTSFDDQQSWITVVIGATCDGEVAKAATTKTGGTRKFAIMYKLESGGVFCQSN